MYCILNTDKKNPDKKKGNTEIYTVYCAFHLEMACSTWQKSYHAENLLTKMFISFSDIDFVILIQFI